jgi:hypothetical protein
MKRDRLQRLLAFLQRGDIHGVIAWSDEDPGAKFNLGGAATGFSA